jgi:hypothetical protein
MIGKQKYIFLAVLTFICTIIVFSQYQSQKNKHDRLLRTGQKVNIVSRHYASGGVDYVNYYFITAQGQRIEDSRKCGNTFHEYIDATAIYNPENPEDYDLSVDFDRYYPTWRIIFFFLIYLPVMVFVLYGFINAVLIIYSRFNK